MNEKTRIDILEVELASHNEWLKHKLGELRSLQSNRSLELVS